MAVVIPPEMSQFIDWAWTTIATTGATTLAMAILIPSTRQPALTREPRNLFIYGRSKVGKSTMCSILPDSLHLDLELGTLMIETRRTVIETPEQLTEVVNQLPEHHKAHPFRFLIVDTIDVVDDWADPIALAAFRALPMGKSFGGSTVRELDRGAGFYYLREAFKSFLRKLMATAQWKTIFLGHVRDKYSDATSKLDNKVTDVDVDLAGKTKSIMCSKMDAIGYAFRDGLGKLWVSFDTKDQTNCGNRSPYLAGKMIPFSTPPTAVDWRQIYPDSLAEGTHAGPPTA